jgi:apolipoprotein N-acyltransferase
VASSRQTFIAATAALVLSGAAFYFGTGLHPIWWLTWIAPIPVLVVAPRLSRRSAFAIAFLAWSIGGTNQWHFFRSVLEIPLVIVCVFIGASALVFALAVLAYRGFLMPRGIVFIGRAALVFPSIWVLAEFINSRISIHSTSNNLAYSQMNFLPILQIASVTGIWGISFCLFLFASTVSILLGGYGDTRERRNLAIAVFGALAVVLGFGFWRLVSTPASSPRAKVALLSSDVRENLITEKPEDTMRLMREYVLQAQKAASHGIKVVVIPEKISIVTPANLTDVDALLHSAADNADAKIIVGIVDVTPEAKWNEARIYTPNAAIRTYNKHHMLPPFESKLKPGTELTEWQEPSGRWGVAICKDMDFPKTGLDYGRDGVGLLLVPAWDFVGDGWLHGRMAILRGVESGFSMARSPKQGILTVTDNRGRVLAEQLSSAEPFVAVLADVPVRNDRTIYGRFGDWFAWANVGLLAVLMLGKIVGRPTFYSARARPA